MSLINHIRRFVVHREPSDLDFMSMCANTEGPLGASSVNEQEMVRYEVSLFVSAIEHTGDTATATSQRQFSREKATHDLVELMYGDVKRNLVKLHQDIRRGNTRGQVNICRQIDQIIKGLSK